MAQEYAYFQGKIVPIESANINIRTHALHYGTGCFEGIRGYWNAEKKQIFILKLEEHYTRLFNSAKILKIKIKPTLQELVQITTELARKNGYQEDFYVRPMAYKSHTKLGIYGKEQSDDLLIYLTPFGAYLDIDKGIKVVVSSWQRIDDGVIPARAKVTGGYINSYLAKSDASELGYDEAIMLNHDGHVAEGSAENIFILRDGKLITPDVSQNILEGVTRNAVIELARNELGLEVIERSVDRTELYIADEIFLCGTGAQISAVVSVDRRSIGTGEIGSTTNKIQKIYFDIVRGNNPKYMSWLTAV